MLCYSAAVEHWKEQVAWEFKDDYRPTTKKFNESLINGEIDRKAPREGDCIIWSTYVDEDYLTKIEYSPGDYRQETRNGPGQG